jgi:hypothetical protein
MSLKKILSIFLVVILLVSFVYSQQSKPRVLGINNQKSLLGKKDKAKFTKEFLADTNNLIIISETPVPTPTPTPSTTPTPTLPPVKNLDEIFDKVSHEQSVERDALKKIALCESGLNPRAANGDYLGLYQFSTNTWITTRRKMNQDANPTLRFSPEDSIKTAAFKIATEGKNAWPNCKR